MSEWAMRIHDISRWTEWKHFQLTIFPPNNPITTMTMPSSLPHQSLTSHTKKTKREKCQAVVVMNLSPIPYRYVVAAQNDKRVFGLGHTITLTVFLFFRAIVELVKRKKRENENWEGNEKWKLIGRDSEALTAMSWHSRSSITGEKTQKTASWVSSRKSNEIH